MEHGGGTRTTPKLEQGLILRAFSQTWRNCLLVSRDEKPSVFAFAVCHQTFSQSDKIQAPVIFYTKTPKHIKDNSGKFTRNYCLTVPDIPWP